MRIASSFSEPGHPRVLTRTRHKGWDGEQREGWTLRATPSLTPTPSMGWGKKLRSRYLSPRGLRHHWDLIGLIDGNDADILVPLLLRQGDILGTVDVAETVDLIVSVWHIHQELVDDGLGRLGALPAQ